MTEFLSFNEPICKGAKVFSALRLLFTCPKSVSHALCPKRVQGEYDALILVTFDRKINAFWTLGAVNFEFGYFLKRQNVTAESQLRHHKSI